MSPVPVSSWFSIALREPYIVLPQPQQPQPQPQQPQIVITTADERHLEGTVTIILTKPTKVRSLRLRFVGIAKSSFFINTTQIAGAKPCAPYDRYNYGSNLFDHPLDILSDNNTKEPRLIPAGAHTFPFKFPVPTSLPAVVSTSSINIHYQVVATLNLVSFLSFSQPYQTVHPVILLHSIGTSSTEEEVEGGIMPLASKCGSRVNGRIHLPCRVLPQAGTVPLTFNLTLQGDTRVSKVVIELWESVVPSCQGQDQETTTTKQADSRLVSRQNCPVSDWPASTHELVAISRRLLFKVPTLPLDFWSSQSDYPLTIDDSRCKLAKGVCHTSGYFPQLGFKLSHTLRAIVYFGELERSSAPADQDTAEYDIEVQVTGQHQTPMEEEHENLLPSYSRSFCSVLVDGAQMQQIDRQSFEALQELMPQWALPPGYEERSSSEGMHPSMDHPSMRPSIETSFSRPSTDTFLSDLALYSERYS
ncbi:hypothetical protein BGZ59_010211 [Podila verticillata]|nr:hypothetical protein BGZ59_010211 [Podila verticillata]